MFHICNYLPFFVDDVGHNGRQRVGVFGGVPSPLCECHYLRRLGELVTYAVLGSDLSLVGGRLCESRVRQAAAAIKRNLSAL